MNHNHGNPYDKDDYPYEHLLWEIRRQGKPRQDRTGTGTISTFGERMVFDLENGSFPLITTKKVFLKGVIYELLWFLRGDTNIKWLNDHGVHIWDEWADENGDLGPIYGRQWRRWDGIDQIQQLVDGLKNDPYSRRHILSAWNVTELDDMALPPCHMMAQFYVEPYQYLKGWKVVSFDGNPNAVRVPSNTNETNYCLGTLNCQLYQRSADMFLGVPFNIAEYALLTMMLAQQTGLQPGRLIWIGGDCHVYANHLDQVDEQLHRLPYDPPRMRITKAKDMFSYSYEDFHLEGYRYHPAIKAPVAV